VKASAGDYRTCRRLLRSGSKSFFAASLLLPPPVRTEASAVYAYCRLADHAIDLSDEPEAELLLLEAQLERVYGGRPDGPVERAFARTALAHGIPRAIPKALLEGFRWDVEGRPYEDLADLLAYCARVGSTVGVMMTLLMGRDDSETIAGACDLGMAMQLTNVARDVGEDARRGRVYIPRAWLQGTEMDVESSIAAPRSLPYVTRAVKKILEAADGLYSRAWPTIELLPARCRPAIRAAALIYADIGREIRAAGHDSVSRRAYTSRVRKGILMARAMSPFDRRPPVPETATSESISVYAEQAREQSRFLVKAVPDSVEQRRGAGLP
jgi:phytoene synthase